MSGPQKHLTPRCDSASLPLTQRRMEGFRDTSWCQYLTWRCSFLHPPTASSANVGEGPSWARTYCPSIIHCVYTLLVCGRGAYTLAWHRGEAEGLKVGAKGVFLWEAVIGLECILRFFNNMEYRVLNGYLMVLLIQHCISKGRAGKF